MRLRRRSYTTPWGTTAYFVFVRNAGEAIESEVTNVWKMTQKLCIEMTSIMSVKTDFNQIFR